MSSSEVSTIDSDRRSFKRRMRLHGGKNIFKAYLRKEKIRVRADAARERLVRDKMYGSPSSKVIQAYTDLHFDYVQALQILAHKIGCKANSK